MVLDALKELETFRKLGQRYWLHSTQITAWNHEILDGAEQVFIDGPVVDVKANE